MNPLVWKFIVEYMQSKRIDTGEYEITDPAGKKYRVRKEGEATTGVEAKRRWANWRMDEFDPAGSDYPDEDWKYIEHVGTLKDAKSHILDNFISMTSNKVLFQRMIQQQKDMQEQLDLLFHEMTASGSLTISGSWYKTIKTVKDANPKP